MIVKCKTCGKPFQTFWYKLKIGRGKYCSTSCRSKANVHILHSVRCDSFKDAGRRQLRKMADLVRMDETKHSQWKGDKVGYHAIHDWLRKHWGAPSECEVCGTNDQSKHYEWANLTHKYLRERSDFKRMCVSCHRKYDWVTRRKNALIKAHA